MGGLYFSVTAGQDVSFGNAVTVMQHGGARLVINSGCHNEGSKSNDKNIY